MKTCSLDLTSSFWLRIDGSDGLVALFVIGVRTLLKARAIA